MFCISPDVNWVLVVYDRVLSRYRLALLLYSNDYYLQYRWNMRFGKVGIGKGKMMFQIRQSGIRHGRDPDEASHHSCILRKFWLYSRPKEEF